MRYIDSIHLPSNSPFTLPTHSYPPSAKTYFTFLSFTIEAYIHCSKRFCHSFSPVNILYLFSVSSFIILPALCLPFVTQWLSVHFISILSTRSGVFHYYSHSCIPCFSPLFILSNSPNTENMLSLSLFLYIYTYITYIKHIYVYTHTNTYVYIFYMYIIHIYTYAYDHVYVCV
jgi:hypothetical protein